MNLKHAQYVLTVLRTGSITEAAKQLYISQPSLSQTIRQAEEQLGMPIFNRDTAPLAHLRGADVCKGRARGDEH